jgi:polysaccharide biosynthesis protein PslH
MKVLIVSPVPTDPMIAGNRARVAALYAALVGLGLDVTFAYAPYESSDIEAMRVRLGPHLRVLRATPPPFPKFVPRLQRKISRTFGLASAHLWRVDEWFDEALTSQILRLQAEERFDSVLIEYVFLSELAAHLPTHVRTVVDTHDLMGNRHERYLRAGMRPQWFSTTRAEELSALNRAKAVIAIQNDEADYLRKNLSTEVFCVGHLLDTNIRMLPDPGGARILFVGSANPINVQGLDWFLKSVFPQIHREMPSTELAIAGPVGRERVWPDRVLVLGDLESLADTYTNATIVINPVQFGTGLPVKTIEALGYGKPVVATPAGIRGIESDFHGALALGQTPEAFAERVLELLKNKETRSALSHNAILAAGKWQRRQLASLHSAIIGRNPAKARAQVHHTVPHGTDGSVQFDA